MKRLLNELEEERLYDISFIALLEIIDLTKAQREYILGEISALISHFKIHSGDVEQVIDEME